VTTRLRTILTKGDPVIPSGIYREMNQLDTRNVLIAREIDRIFVSS
jgi:hypothetical protein